MEETSACCTVNHWALASNYQLSNTKRPAQDSNRRPKRLEVKTLPLHHRAPKEVIELAEHTVSGRSVQIMKVLFADAAKRKLPEKNFILGW